MGLEAKGGVECGEGRVEVGIVVGVDVLVLLVLWCGDVEYVVSVGVVVRGAGVSGSLVGGDVRGIDEGGEFVRQVRGELAEGFSDEVGHEYSVVFLVFRG